MEGEREGWKVKLDVSVDGKVRAIEFSFDPEKDTVGDLSKDIAVGFRLDEEQEKKVRQEIEAQMKQAKAAEGEKDVVRQGGSVPSRSHGVRGAGGRGAVVYKKGAVTVIEVPAERLATAKEDKNPSRGGGNANLNHELIEYAARGNLKMVQVHLSSGADVNFANYCGRTALHLAVNEDQEEVVRFLLKSGASYKLRDRRGATPLDDAMSSGSFLSIQALYDYGAEVKRELVKGVRERHILSGYELISAVADGNLAEVRRLLGLGINPNARNYDKRTALHLASAENLDEVAMELFAADADPYAKDTWDLTPIGEALRNGNMELARLFGYKDPGIPQPNLNF